MVGDYANVMDATEQSHRLTSSLEALFLSLRKNTEEPSLASSQLRLLGTGGVIRSTLLAKGKDTFSTTASVGWGEGGSC